MGLGERVLGELLTGGDGPAHAAGEAGDAAEVDAAGEWLWGQRFAARAAGAQQQLLIVAVELNSSQAITDLLGWAPGRGC